MKSQARLRLHQPDNTLYMPRVAGKSFRCRCGANVFRKRREMFICNACGLWYR